MAHPLDGARLKIVRAQEHLDSLKGAIADYLRTNPYIVSMEGDPDLPIYPAGFMATIAAHPPPRLSAIVGDCLHNLACALDYIIWEIAGTFANRALIPPPNGQDRPYFPIWNDPNRFASHISSLNDPKGRDYKIPDRVITQLRTVQPFPGSRYEPLWLLRMLVNADKHRLPLLIVGEMKEYSIAFVLIEQDPKIPPHLTDDPDYYKPKVNTQATIQVTWQDPVMPREPVDRTLANVAELVADVIPRFDHFVL